ncbi:hypothetical protein [Burkholderia sp. 22PA0106]
MDSLRVARGGVILHARSQAILFKGGPADVDRAILVVIGVPEMTMA